MAQVRGTWDPRFKKVRTLFQAFLDSGTEIGASLTVNLAGETVLDLYGGHTDAERTRPWQRDTLVPVASSTKTVTAFAVLMLVEDGAMASVYDKVSKYWPEFAANGKHDIEIRHLLSHTSGVAGWEDPITMAVICDLDSDATAKLAAQAPCWEPGTAGGYHAWNYGHLLGEVVRRVTGGVRLKDFVAQRIAGPLGADFQIGLRQEDEGRVSEFIPTPSGGGGMSPGFKPGPLFMKAIANPAMPPDFGRTHAWRDGEVGASNGVTNARALNTILSKITLAGSSIDESQDEKSTYSPNQPETSSSKSKPAAPTSPSARTSGGALGTPCAATETRGWTTGCRRAGSRTWAARAARLASWMSTASSPSRTR